jgi:triacylglycerol lipase
MRFRLLLAVLCLVSALAAGTPGNLRYGAVPAGSGARPVLLFVHGWNSDASTWSGSNDMEAKATTAGYRTAFLDVYPDRTMWDNGVLVAAAVDQVKARFTGAGVVLVCHSKGGVDGQTALVYDGAASKVERLITLGTPHRGTPLADLAWSWWAGWLADLLGSRNDGNRVLQTGYMAAFRAQTDALAASRAVPTYTAGGTKAGPWFSSYWYGGIAIGRTSDGVVPLDATDLPYQQARLFTRSWNHAEVKQGSNAWPYLQASLAQPVPLAAPALAAAALPEPSLLLDRLYRGGRTEGGMAEATFPVEAGQPLLRVLLQTAQTPRRALLISPSGRLHAFSRSLAGPHRLPRVDRLPEDGTGDAAFPGAAGSTVSVPDPEPGLWRLQLSAQGEDAYFLTAAFPGDRSAPMPLADARGLARGRAIPLAAAAAGLSVAVHTVPTTPPARALKVGAGQVEPSVLNRTLVLTWPGGKERDLVFSEAE